MSTTTGRSSHPEAGPGDATEPEGVQDSGVATAWGLLSSPRVFFGLTLVLGVLLAWAQRVPQRPAPGELAAHAPFAEAEALGALGFDDVWLAWPVLLVGLLLVLVALGIAMRRARGDLVGAFVAERRLVVAQPLERVRERLPAALGGGRIALREARGVTTARRGLAIEALIVLGVGLGALAAGLVIGRTNGFEGRLTLVPGQVDEPSSLSVRDGDLLLPRALPLDLRCSRPDPMDPSRTQACGLTTTAGAGPEGLSLQPGATTTIAGVALTPWLETRRSFAPNEPLELVVRRDATAPVERLMLEPGQPVELSATGQRLQTFVGPDGPLVLVTGPGAPALYAPPISAEPPAASEHTLELAVVAPTRQVVLVAARPERLLTILGLAFLALGLVLLGRVPSVVALLVKVDGGTRVHLRGSDPALVARAAAHLVGSDAR